jgi:peptide deformylase
MTILPLVLAPDPRLEMRSEAVETVDDSLRGFLDDMVETMQEEDGVGLAAVQVGVLKRILVMEVADETTQENIIYHLINPEITEASDEINVYDEGCLSFPGQRAKVERPERVTVKALDYHGKEQIIECDGLLATCVQHEIDHLNGVVFIDHVSKLKHDMIMNKMRKLKKKFQ